jgi:hypothetical protein
MEREGLPVSASPAMRLPPRARRPRDRFRQMPLTRELFTKFLTPAVQANRCQDREVDPNVERAGDARTR